MFKGCQNVNKVKWNIASKSSNSVVQFYKYNRQNWSLCLPSRLPVNARLFFFSTFQFSCLFLHYFSCTQNLVKFILCRRSVWTINHWGVSYVWCSFFSQLISISVSLSQNNYAYSWILFIIEGALILTWNMNWLSGVTLMTSLPLKWSSNFLYLVISNMCQTTNTIYPNLFMILAANYLNIFHLDVRHEAVIQGDSKASVVLDLPKLLLVLMILDHFCIKHIAARLQKNE